MRIERARVALGMLPDVEPHQREPERRGPAEQIGQPPVGDDLLAGLDERPVAERDRFDQLVDRFVRMSLDDVVLRMIAGGGVRAADASRVCDQPQPRPLAGGEESLSDVAEHRAIRFAGSPSTRLQLGDGIGHRQIEPQCVHIPQVQIGSAPARGIARDSRDFWRDVWIAIAIAADPRSETDRRGVEWQRPAGRPPECRIERPKVAREGVPDRLLEDQEAARDLVEWVGLSRPDLFRFPRRGDFTAQLLDRLGALRHGQVGAIEPHQRVRDVQVLVNQRAPGDLRRMRREHELDPQRARSLVEGLGRHAAGYQPRKGLFARRWLWPGCRIALIVPTPPHAMVLLGDVCQREEVGERSRDWQRSFDRQVPQDARERTDIVSSHPLAQASTALAPARPCRRAPVPRAAGVCRRAARPASAHRPAAARVDPWGDRISVGGLRSAVDSRQSTVAVGSHSRQRSRQSHSSVAFLERRAPSAERRAPTHFTL